MEKIAMALAGDWGVWPWNAIGLLYLIVMILSGDTKGARLRRARQFKPENSHGAATLAANSVLKAAGLFGGKGIPIGFSPDGRHALHYEGVGHLLTVAAARTGKGATLLVNALLSIRDTSCIVICPKAENTVITAHFRRRFGQVYVLNPFRMFAKELEGVTHARLNPMQIIEADSLSFHASCDKLAAALVWEEGNGEGRHWTMAARMLVSGIIAALIRHGDPERRTLVEVARIVSSGDDLFTFCRNALQSSDPFIRQKLGRFTAPEVNKDREIWGVVSTASVQLSFIGNAAIAESLSSSDFRFSDLKKKRATIYICLPLAMLDVTDKYFRLILETALTDLLNERTRS
jgi:type IV secretion system protein VirD4